MHIAINNIIYNIRDVNVNHRDENSLRAGYRRSDRSIRLKVEKIAQWKEPDGFKDDMYVSCGVKKVLGIIPKLCILLFLPGAQRKMTRI